MEINIKDILYEESSTHIKIEELQTIGIYKVTKDCYDFSSTSSGIYKSPSIPLDVKSCYEFCTAHCPNMAEQKNYFDGLVKLLTNNPSLLTNNGNKVIALRRTIAKILQMPEDAGLENENFRFRATKFKSNVFIAPMEPFKTTVLKKRMSKARTEEQIFKLNCISGLEDVDIPELVINQVNYACAYERKLEDLSILFFSISAPLSITENDEQKCVITKLLRKTLNVKYFYVRRKLLTWWCFYNISNIDAVYCGILKNGKVQEIPERIQIADLKQISNNFWEPKKLLSFAYKFLKMITNIIEETEDRNMVYEFYFNSKKGTIAWKQLKIRKSEAFLTDELIAAQQ